MDDAAIGRLLSVMAALRHPESGCAWDRAQTFASIAPYTIEEAYEVADAIARGDLADLRDELGDLLLQVVFHARLAEEAGAFAFEDVADAIVAKMIRRHPHVFDAAGGILPAERRHADISAINASWDRIKAEERAGRAARGAAPEEAGRLGPIPHALPALTRAEKVSRKAAGYGFDWPDAREVVAKVREEIAEVEECLPQNAAEEVREELREAVAEEIGDLLFSVANLARHAGVDPEEALRRGTRKFERRFEAMAAELERGGGSLASSGLGAMEAAWQAVKRAETA